MECRQTEQVPWLDSGQKEFPGCGTFCFKTETALGQVEISSTLPVKQILPGLLRKCKGFLVPSCCVSKLLTNTPILTPKPPPSPSMVAGASMY